MLRIARAEPEVADKNERFNMIQTSSITVNDSPCSPKTFTNASAPRLPGKANHPERNHQCGSRVL